MFTDFGCLFSAFKARFHSLLFRESILDTVSSTIFKVDNWICIRVTTFKSGVSFV